MPAAKSYRQSGRKNAVRPTAKKPEMLVFEAHWRPRVAGAHGFGTNLAVTYVFVPFQQKWSFYHTASAPGFLV